MSDPTADLKRELDRICALLNATEARLNAALIKVDFAVTLPDGEISFIRLGKGFRLCLDGKPVTDIKATEKLYVAEELPAFEELYLKHLKSLADRARRIK